MAQDATWLASPGSIDFNSAANWNPATVPTGTAFFDVSGVTGLSITSDTAIGGWTFNAGASNYTFNTSQILDFTGAGITVNGGSASISTSHILRFINSTAGGASIDNTGSLLFDDSTAGSATIINRLGGTLHFIDSSTAGSATITNNGSMAFGGTANGGTAAFVTNATGSVDISNLSAGGMTAGSIAGAGNYLLGDKQLTVGGNNQSTTVSGAIQDGGSGAGAGASLVKVGTGTLTLTNNSNTYSGVTTVDAGVLVVSGSGSIAGSSLTTVNSGATIGGDGTVGDLSVASGGIVAPGNSIGTLIVAGDATFNAGSTYVVEVNAAGQADLLSATGAVTINGGTVQVVPLPDYVLNTPYTIITATGGVSGAGFSSATFSSLFVTPQLTYNAYSVDLTLMQTAALGDWAVTSNQRAAAGAADALGAGNDVFDAAMMIGSAGAAQAAFDALSGEGHATIKGVLIENSAVVRDAAFGRLESAFAAPETAGAASGYAGEPVLSGESTYGGGLWGQLHGGLGSLASDGNAAAADFAGGGVALGTDGALGDWRLGVVVHAGMIGVSIPDRDTTGTSTDYGAGLYGGTKWGDTGLAFGAAYTRHAISTTREVSLPGFTDTLTAEYGAATGQVFGEINHEFDLGDVSFTPFAQVAYVNHATDAFTEQGGAAALSSAASVIDSTFTTLGLRGSHKFVAGGDGLATLSGGLGWRHAFADVPSASNAFAGGSTFTVSGAPVAADALVLEAGLGLDLATGVDISLAYAGQVGTTGQSHALKAGLSGRF